MTKLKKILAAVLVLSLFVGFGTSVSSFASLNPYGLPEFPAWDEYYPDSILMTSTQIGDIEYWFWKAYDWQTDEYYCNICSIYSLGEANVISIPKTIKVYDWENGKIVNMPAEIDTHYKESLENQNISFINDSVLDNITQVNVPDVGYTDEEKEDIQTMFKNKAEFYDV